MTFNKQVHVSTILMASAIVLILATGLIHLVEAPENYSEVAYKGILFYLNAVFALVSAYGIYRQKSWGWWFGVIVAGGSLVMYAVSRTIGLPGLPAADETWLETSGVISMIAEVGFLVIAGSVFVAHEFPTLTARSH